MLTWEKIKPYLEISGDLPKKQLLHPFYDEAKKYREEMIELFGDKYPKWMDLNRPRESDDHKKYRKEIFANPIKPVQTRVFGFIKSIQNSADYYIRYADESNEEVETFEHYVKEKFGLDGSLENWIWNEGIDAMKIDPNSVMVFIPKETTNELNRRDVEGKFLPCTNVWQLKRGEFAVIESDEKTQLQGEIYEQDYSGKILYFFDTESYCVAKQLTKPDPLVNNDFNYFTQWEVMGFNAESQTLTPDLHYCEGLPVVKVGRLLKDQKMSRRYELFVSELEPVIANLKKAIRRDSDREVEAIVSTTTLHWRMATGECKNCAGTGKKNDLSAEGYPIQTTCKVCGGSGKDTPKTSLDMTVVSTEKINEGLMGGDKVVNPIIPPGGSVQNVPINMQAMRTEYSNEVEESFTGLGLGTFNYLALNQSGVAKREDKEEGIRFFVNMANHIAKNLLIWGHWCVASIRYGISGKQLDLMPTINIPTRTNLDTIDEVRNQLKEAIETKMDSGIIDTLQLKLLKLEAGDDSLEYNRYHLRMRLDGFRNMSEQQKWFAIGNLATLGDRNSDSYLQAVKAYQFSINFDKIYQDAIIETEGFDAMMLSEKKKIMDEIAKRYETIKPASEPITQLTQNPPVNVINQNQI